MPETLISYDREQMFNSIYPHVLDGTEQHCEDIHKVVLTLMDLCPHVILDRLAREFKIDQLHDDINVMGIRFPWPGILIASGLTKNGDALDGLQALGVSGIEAGTFPPLKRKGNPLVREYTIDGSIRKTPRIARDNHHQLINNWMNFPSKRDIPEAMRHLDQKRKRCSIPVGVSIVENPESAQLDDKLADILLLMTEVYPHHPDWITYDVSCPNGVLSPEAKKIKATTMCKCVEQLAEIGEKFREKFGYRIPLLVKLSPDIEKNDLISVVETGIAVGIDGFVATNTTTDRKPVRALSPYFAEIPKGGYSGPFLFEKSILIVEQIREIESWHQPKRKLVIIGCGGIDTAQKVNDMHKAGADLVQVLSGFIFHGPYFFKELKRGLIELE